MKDTAVLEVKKKEGGGGGGGEREKMQIDSLF